MGTVQLTTGTVDNPTAFLRELQRRSLSAFTAGAFHDVKGKGYVGNWHIDAVTWHLEEVERGALKRLMITLPPRQLKSFTASVTFPAWVLGRDPTRKVICISYSQDLAKNLANEFRRVRDLPRYRELFPGTWSTKGKNTELEQETAHGGFRLATSIDGTLTGRGGDIIIIDDPIKAGSVMSDAERSSVNHWYHSSLVSRPDNKKEGAIIIVMQRLHEDDLVGHLTERENHGWTVLNIPAIAPADFAYRVGNGITREYYRRAGELIQPDREDREHLDRLREDLGEYLFSAQYQQQPLPPTGNLIRREWLKSYAVAPDRKEFEFVAQSWDTASHDGDRNDFSVCTTWGVKGKELYLLHVSRKKLAYPELRKEAIQLAREYRPQLVLIERAQTGFALVKDLKADYSDARFPDINPRGDKINRVAGVSSLIEQGRVFIPTEAHWRLEFLNEVLGFPGKKHDDQVDSMEQFLRYIQRDLRRPICDPETGRRITVRRDVIHRR